MYLRESKQKRADGTAVTYLQIAENVWSPQKQRSQARIVYNCGRGDQPEVIERLRRLAKSILKRCSPEEIVAEAKEWTRSVLGLTGTSMLYLRSGDASGLTA